MRARLLQLLPGLAGPCRRNRPSLRWCWRVNAPDDDEDGDDDGGIDDEDNDDDVDNSVGDAGDSDDDNHDVFDFGDGIRWALID